MSVRPVELDFLHPHPRVPWAAWALLAGGIALVALAVWRHQELAGDLAREAGVALRLKADSRPAPAMLKDKRAAKQVTGSELQARLELPWSHLFRSLEQTRPKSIALLSLEADERRGEATLTAEARHREAMLAYLEDLKKTSGLKTVVLASHEVREEDEQRPLRFVFRVGWRE